MVVCWRCDTEVTELLTVRGWRAHYVDDDEIMRVVVDRYFVGE